MIVHLQFPKTDAPILLVLFRDNRGAAGGNRQARQLAAVAHPGQKDRYQRCLSALPLTGKQSQFAGAYVAVPKPVATLMRGSIKILRPNAFLEDASRHHNPRWINGGLPRV